MIVCFVVILRLSFFGVAHRFCDDGGAASRGRGRKGWWLIRVSTRSAHGKETHQSVNMKRRRKKEGKYGTGTRY